MKQASRWLAVLLVALAAGAPATSRASGPEIRAGDGKDAPEITVYGAAWCGACRSLERALKARDIPFLLVDVDANGAAYARARRAARTNAIPLTSVEDGVDVTWIVGADADAVERAYRR